MSAPSAHEQIPTRTRSARSVIVPEPPQPQLLTDYTIFS